MILFLSTVENLAGGYVGNRVFAHGLGAQNVLTRCNTVTDFCWKSWPRARWTLSA